MISCPICNNTVLDHLFTIDKWYILRCYKCTSQFVHPMPSDSEIKEYYSRYYSGNDTHLKDLLNPKYGRLSFPRQWGIIERLVKKRDGNILDFGCGGGHFLDRVSKNWQRYGVDLSDEARAISLQKNIFTYNTIEPYQHWGEYFDVITMFATIEHLPRPSETVEQLSKLLKVGGIMVVMTGDVDSLWAYYKKHYWAMYAPPGHLHFFTAQSLDYLMESSGFKKIKHIYTDGGMITLPTKPLNYSFRALLETWHRIPKVKELPIFDTYYGYYKKWR